MTLREQTIEACRIELDPAQEGIVRECFRIVDEVISKLPIGTFSDELSPHPIADAIAARYKR